MPEQQLMGILFDFNGTLFQDGIQQEKAWRSFAKKAFSKEISDAEFREYIHGRNNAFIMEYLSGEKLDVEQIDWLVEEKETLYRALCYQNPESFHLTKGAERLLGELVERNIPHNIATASRRSNVDFYIKSFDLKRWFNVDKIVYDDGTIKGKPEPDYYLLAAERIGVPAKNCLVLEDAVSGILSGYHAGCRTIAVAPREKQSMFQNMKETFAVIEDFDEFDRGWAF